MAKKYQKRTTEEIRQETNELTQQALEAVEKFTKSPESIKELMDFMSKFPERSFRNQVLIQKQFPGAQACLGRAALKKNQIFIRKGEKGNKIFVRKTVKGFYDKKRGFVREIYATKEDRKKIEQGEIKIEKKPYYSIEKVFDITQTQLKPEDYPKVFPNRVFDFQLDNKGKHELQKGIDSLAREMNISIKDMKEGTVFRGELGAVKGAYVHNPNTDKEEIVLNTRNTQSENLATSIHELAHAKMHKFSQYDTSIEELQAEMTSYIVSNHFGLDTSESSIPYIADWTNNGKQLNMMEPAEKGKILNDVSRVANKFIQTISTEINQQRERELGKDIQPEKTDQEKASEQFEVKQKVLNTKSILNESFYKNLKVINDQAFKMILEKEGQPFEEKQLKQIYDINQDAHNRFISDPNNQELKKRAYIVDAITSNCRVANNVLDKSEHDDAYRHVSLNKQTKEFNQVMIKADKLNPKMNQETQQFLKDQGKSVNGVFQTNYGFVENVDEYSNFLNKSDYSDSKGEIASTKNLKDEVISIKDSVWVDRITGKVSHDDNGRCLALKDGKYIKRADHVDLSGKIFNQEVNTTLSKDHFYSGYPFKFPKEQVNDIVNDHELKSRIVAEQKKQIERA